MNNLISIITPNFNCEVFIKSTIESVISQTYSNWEMLIVDDCSTDRSYEIALDYAKKDSRVKVLKNDTVLDILIIIILVLAMIYSFNINIFNLIGG